MKDITILSVCNKGYLNMTINLFYSLQKCQLENNFTCACLDEDSFRELSQLFKNTSASCFLYQKLKVPSEKQQYGKKGWMDVMLAKMDVIHTILSQNKNIIFTDSDIVWRKNPLPLIKNIIEENINSSNQIEMLFQVDSKYDQSEICLCGGFYYCKSTKNTINLFDISRVDLNKHQKEQPYLNMRIIQDKIKVNILPRELFPNGSFWYKYHDILDPYVVHFNWTKDDKIELMKKYKMWKIPY